jgi:hypothetical protein
MTHYNAHLTLKSRNEKTGNIPVSTTSEITCPDACPFSRKAALANGTRVPCYAAHGHVDMHWRKVTDERRGKSWEAFCADVARKVKPNALWRHNQAGDLPGNRVEIDRGALDLLISANAGKRGFTYTHYTPQVKANADAIKTANAAGFTINLSANNLTHADVLLATGCGPVVVVLPASVDGAETKTVTTPNGATVVVCPATYRDDVTCKTCGLCQVATRKTVVGFPAHGAGKAVAA